MANANCQMCEWLRRHLDAFAHCSLAMPMTWTTTTNDSVNATISINYDHDETVAMSDAHDLVNLSA